jgi:hypothetical protein
LILFLVSLLVLFAVLWGMMLPAQLPSIASEGLFQIAVAGLVATLVLALRLLLSACRTDSGNTISNSRRSS